MSEFMSGFWTAIICVVILNLLALMGFWLFLYMYNKQTERIKNGTK
jgi:hypothetical protein